MRFCCILCLLFCITASHSAHSQTATSQAPSIFEQQAQMAFAGGKPVVSVVMTGTAQWISGSQKESGPVKLTANVNGENSIELDLTSGTRTESQSAITDDRTCAWSGKDGVVHEVAPSNCWTATVWFLPHLALQSTGLPSALSVQNVAAPPGRVADSPHLRHQLTIAPGKTKPAVTALIQSWSKTDLTLDPATNLPSVLKYTIHPDNNSSVNLQVEVRYSKYQNVSGAEVPMHIERYVNGSLQVNIDIDSATVN